MKLTTSSRFTLALLLVVPAFSLQAADMSIKCDKKPLADTIAKLDKLQPNTVNISGDCNEDVVISGHKDLKLIGDDGASISATVFDPGDFLASTTALSVENSTVTIQNLTINAGRDGVSCYTGSVCTLQDVTIPGGHGGVSAQGGSTLYIYGSSSFTNILGSAVGVFGGSRADMSPGAWNSDWTGLDAPDVSNNVTGVLVLDGSFFRSDGATFSNNSFVGIYGLRNSNLKVFGDQAGTGVSFNGYGFAVESGSTLQTNIPITNNAYDGIYVGALSAVQRAGPLPYPFSDNGGLDVNCDHPTAVDLNFGVCP